MKMRSAQRGFSLLELLVAFAIMGLSLGILYRAAGSSARSVGDAAQYQSAVVLAESLMAVRESVPATGWNASGLSGPYSWSVQSALFPTPVSNANLSAPRLHEVVYAVTWQEGERSRRIDFVTLLPEDNTAAESALRR
jgi:general secretion pathway protein I